MTSIFEEEWAAHERDLADRMAGSVTFLPMTGPINGRGSPDLGRPEITFQGIIDEEFPEAKLPGEQVTSRIRRYGNITVLHAMLSELDGVAMRQGDIVINNDLPGKPRYRVVRTYPDGLTWFYAELTRE